MSRHSCKLLVSARHRGAYARHSRVERCWIIYSDPVVLRSIGRGNSPTSAWIDAWKRIMARDLAHRAPDGTFR